MSKFGTIIMGPAGAGKSTFCAALITHLRLSRRTAFYVNLDPAATTFEHAPDLDIRDLISLHDAMTELGLGPNGGLVYCLEFLLDNLDWLADGLAPVPETALVLFDLPGQVELYTHVPVLPALVRFLARPGDLALRLVAVYLLEATSVVDRARFLAGSLAAMSAMLMLEVPHLNVLSKTDLVRDQVRRRDLEAFLTPGAELLDTDPLERRRRLAEGDDDGDGGEYVAPGDRGQVIKGAGFRRLNRAVAELIESFSMVNYLKLDVTDEDSVADILSYIDDCLQFHEAQDPRDPNEDIEVDEAEQDD